MRRLIRIAFAALLASSLLASPASADPKGRGGHGDGWGRERQYDRGPPNDRGRPDWRRDRYEPRPPRGGRWEEAPSPLYGYPGPPSYARRTPPPVYRPRRGGQIPPSYRGAIVPDYSRHRLRQPPPGFAWVRMGDRYLLVSRATGQIFDVIGD